MNNKSTAVSVLLIVGGAILAWALDYRLVDIDITVVGAMLMVVGLIGLLLSVLFWASFAPFARRRRRHARLAVPRAAWGAPVARRPWKSPPPVPVAGSH